MCSLATWVCHLMLHWRFNSGSGMEAVTFNAFHSTSGGLSHGHLGEILVSCSEMIYGLLTLPAWVVAAALGLHLSLVYSSLRREGLQPTLPWTLVWFIIQSATPYLLYFYMRRTAVHRRGKGCDQPSRTASCSRRCSDEVVTGDVVEEHQDAPVKVCSDQLADTQSTSQQGEQEPQNSATSTPRSICQQQPAARRRSTEQLHSGLGFPHDSCKSSLQSLANAQRLLMQVQAQRSYKSRLAQSQIVIKLKHSEPHQLAPDVVGDSQQVLEALGHVNLLVSRACARKGCALLTFDLVQAPAATADEGCLARPGEGGGSIVSESVIQAWLAQLLAPGVVLPDNAVAHVVMNGIQLEARWQRQTSSWTVSPLAPVVSAPMKLLSLLHVDGPVAWLVPTAVSASQAASSAGRHHRMSLLLKVQHPASSLSFVGSDASAAAPAQGTEEKGASAIQCVARGSWGTCLPVVVAGAEAEGQPAASSSTIRDVRHMHPERFHDGYMLQEVPAGTLIALTLDVDLGSAPHAGALQLELYSGHTILVSAPLLLLPSQLDSNTDACFEELQRTFSQHSWEEGGATAFLTDLGQLLSAAEVINGAGNHATGGPEVHGPQAWGGIPASTARQLSSSRPLLSSCLVMSEGLLEYAAAEGLTATSHLVLSLSDTVKQRLEQVQGAGEEDQQSAEATTSAAAGCEEGEQGSSSQGLRKRQLHHLPSANKASSSQPGAPASDELDTAALKAKHRQAQARWQLTMAQAAQAVVRGFGPDVEQQYRKWVAEHYQVQIRSWALVTVAMVVVSTIKSALLGTAVLQAHLPAHLLIGAPYVGSVLVVAKAQQRWRMLEGVLMMHAGFRALASWVCYLGMLAWPPSYSLLWKIRVDVWGEVLLHAPFEPMRLPYLPVSIFFSGLAAYAIAGLSDESVRPSVMRVVVPRLGTLAVGLALDMMRRFSFVRHQAPVLALNAQ